MKKFIFAFILFALLLTVNAAPFQLNKRATTFGSCPYPYVDSLNVTMVTDPPKSEKSDSFNVSGNLTQVDITKNQTLLEIFYCNPDGSQIGDYYSQVFNESIKAGTQFTVTASDVPTPKLPDSYLILVIIGDKDNDPSNPYHVVLYACVVADVV
ncbi:hypothetical protein F8M41_016012 [Gigaspora margarita]|uniref:MD-2-related lipid-recognition domain-containing protein n=1 Tax=Gigaspora margarita TaxID=4874 RepID=A0A8H4EN02_GIGMA|nr:hypothetical protein F8M41_016012 [Gigaspora margarita]